MMRAIKIVLCIALAALAGNASATGLQMPGLGSISAKHELPGMGSISAKHDAMVGAMGQAAGAVGQAASATVGAVGSAISAKHEILETTIDGTKNVAGAIISGKRDMITGMAGLAQDGVALAAELHQDVKSQLLNKFAKPAVSAAPMPTPHHDFLG